MSSPSIAAQDTKVRNIQGEEQALSWIPLREDCDEKIVCLAALIAFFLYLPVTSTAKIGRPSLALLTRLAHVIVLAEIEKVSSEGGGERIATARVLEVLKGNPGQQISFRASRTGSCDTSIAVEGETVILFLSGNPNAQDMSITYAGRGRLPVTHVEGRARVSVPMPLTHGVKNRLDGAALPQAWIGSRDVDVLKEHVARLIKQNLMM